MAAQRPPAVAARAGEPVRRREVRPTVPERRRFAAEQAPELGPPLPPVHAAVPVAQPVPRSLPAAGPVPGRREQALPGGPPVGPVQVPVGNQVRTQRERQRRHERHRTGNQHRERPGIRVLSGSSPVPSPAIDRLDHLGVGESRALSRRERRSPRQGQLSAGLGDYRDRHGLFRVAATAPRGLHRDRRQRCRPAAMNSGRTGRSTTGPDDRVRPATA